MSFDSEFEKLRIVEGGYSNDSNDSGGATKYGVTESVARANGYKDAMADMPLSAAKVIYRNQYWDHLKLDQVDALYPEVASELFDTGVNQGTGKAAVFLQRALNVLNCCQKYYGDVKADGSIGPMTLHALERYKAVRGAEGGVILNRMLNCLQGAFYVDLCEKREKDETFVYGWFKNRVQ